MSLKAFLKSRQLLIHLSMVVALFVVVVYVTMLLLRVYTHHGESMDVPDFKGLTEKEVKIVAKQSKLRYNIIDSVFVPDAMSGTIISQQPDVGYKVKQHRTIYLTILAISPEKVMVPAIVDVSLREAQGRLENAGLRLGQVIYQPSEFFNLVLNASGNGASLPVDTLLVRGSYVDLVVGKGLSNEKTEVPALFGLALEDAKRALYKVSLNIGALIYDDSFVTGEDSLNAQIWKQNPESIASKNVELGSSVDLWLTVDREKLDLNDEIEF
jgi:beta-lactam-binding protein with PASTA domain